MTRKPKQRFFLRGFYAMLWVFAIFLTIFAFNKETHVQKDARSLNIFSWSGIIDQEIINQFEKKHNIRVNLDYFSSNEELILKLKATKGKGYDLIIQSDYATKILIQENLLKPLDKSKLDFIDDIDPFLLSHGFDQDNTYSLPIEWDICGFGIDSKNEKLFNQKLSWAHLFEEDKVFYKIAMSNDPVEAFCIASFYLYGPKDSLNEAEAKAVTELLKKQKKWIEAYAVPRSDYLLASKNASIALALNGFVMQAKKDFPNLEFVLPQKATFISIESVTIPKVSENNDRAYQFLNFLFQKDNLAKCSNTYGFFPATKASDELYLFYDEYNKAKKIIESDGYQLFFFKHLLPEDTLRKLWISVKS